MQRFISFGGLMVMILLAWLCSNNRRKMNLRLILSGIGLQFLLAFLLLETPPGEIVFEWARFYIAKIIGFAAVGPAWLLGDRVVEFLGPQCVVLNMIPPIIFVSALMAVLFYLGIMQQVVKLMARVMVWVMDTSGSESLCAAANVFMGMAEAPLVIRPYLESMTRSEIMAMMTTGLATVAGGVMAAYVAQGIDAGHLLAASLMSAPAALVLAKIMIPETEESVTKSVVKIDVPRQDANVFDAACRGASDGMMLSLNIIAGLIAILGIVALINWPLSAISPQYGGPYSLERLLSWLFAPLAWVMGVEAKDVWTVGELLGKRMVMNEYIAYVDLAKIQHTLAPRSLSITIYAMCGFANFGSVAILIGGLGYLMPGRRKEMAKLGLRALVAGTLASFMTACIAGMLL
jgi:CNT family concentrative nucleoside transporter